MLLFRKKKPRFFPADKDGRRKVIMEVHRQIASNDDIRDLPTIELVLDQIADETDPFFIDSYLIYYIGTYKPFVNRNEDTAKVLADGVLADHGLEIPQNEIALSHIAEAFSGQHTIDSIVEWQMKHAVKKK